MERVRQREAPKKLSKVEKAFYGTVLGAIGLNAALGADPNIELSWEKQMAYVNYNHINCRVQIVHAREPGYGVDVINTKCPERSTTGGYQQGIGVFAFSSGPEGDNKVVIIPE